MSFENPSAATRTLLALGLSIGLIQMTYGWNRVERDLEGAGHGLDNAVQRGLRSIEPLTYPLRSSLQELRQELSMTRRPPIHHHGEHRH